MSFEDIEALDPLELSHSMLLLTKERMVLESKLARKDVVLNEKNLKKIMATQ